MADRRAIAMCWRCIRPSHRYIRRAAISTSLPTPVGQIWGIAKPLPKHRDESWPLAIYALPRRRAVAGIELPAFEDFWRTGYVALPPPTDDFVLFDDFSHDPAAHPRTHAERAHQLASPTLRTLSDDCGTHPNWQPPVEWLSAPAAKTYPLHLVSVQPADRLHSQLDPAPLAQGG